MNLKPLFIEANWQVPKNIKAITTTRFGGVSDTKYSSLNLGMHVGDSEKNVQENRELITKAAQLPRAPYFINQVHGANVVTAENSTHTTSADALITNKKNIPCAIMSADCLPILLCNQQGTQIAAIHAGWRGLAAGIIESTLTKMNINNKDILVWLGPAISQEKFEVGFDVYNAFTNKDKKMSTAFIKRNEKYLANIAALAVITLNNLGVTNISKSELCSFNEEFYSYRRDHGTTGRMASIIWMED